MPEATIRVLPESLRADAARLYWEAFGGKLGRVMGPERLALRYLEGVIRTDHAMAAISASGDLVGVAGFRTASGTFVGGTRAQMATVYGRVGAAWRAAMLWLLERQTDDGRLLLDGICVTVGARDHGIGTRLMQAIFAEARARGYRAVRLDVVEGNGRARQLYERLGFVAIGTERLGLARYVFGFAASTAMVRTLDASDR